VYLKEFTMIWGADNRLQDIKEGANWSSLNLIVKKIACEV
jgi:hypothetical protein